MLKVKHTQRLFSSTLKLHSNLKIDKKTLIYVFINT